MPAIYALVRSDTNKVYYIGKTADPIIREEQHLFTKPRHLTRDLMNQGIEVRFEILREYSSMWIDNAEVAWINRFLDKGISLDNHIGIGGGGCRFASDDNDFMIYLEFKNGKRVYYDMDDGYNNPHESLDETLCRVYEFLAKLES